jgi:hypothetical protein
MVSRRATLLSLGTALSAGFAGCSESADDAAQSTTTATKSDTDQTESTSREIPGPDEGTLLPQAVDPMQYGLLETRTVAEDIGPLNGGTTTAFRNVSPWTFAHVEFYHADIPDRREDSRYRSAFETENRYFLEPDTETEVSVMNVDEIPEVKRLYREGYYPPSEPYYGRPDHAERSIVSGTETERGIMFELTSLDGELRDFYSGTWAHLMKSSDGVTIEGNRIVIPWESVERNYLARPLHPFTVETFDSSKQVFFEPPTPEVSVETTVDVTDEGENLRIDRITFDVKFDTQKPTQYVSAYAVLDHAHFSTMYRDPTLGGQVPIEGSGTVELDGGTVSLPLDSTILKLMVMQNAPLYVEHRDIRELL